MWKPASKTLGSSFAPCNWLGDQVAPEAHGHCVRPGAGLQLRQQVADVRLDRLLREEEADADLAVHETVGDQLQHLDLTGGRLLLELLERPGERDDLPAGRVAAAPLSDRVEAAAMTDVARQDLFALSSVHASRIGLRPIPL